MIDKDCQYLIGKRCGIRRFPEKGSPAFNDLSMYSKKEAMDSGFQECQPGSYGCFPKHSKSLAVSKWKERAGFD
jgi:hypothetical protein